MKKVNLRDIPSSSSTSPKGKYGRSVQDVSVALGRIPDSMDLRERHPFDVQVCTVPAGKARCPLHAHGAQWEYFQVLSGRGAVRHDAGTTAIETGDAFLFGPHEAHQLINDSDAPLVILIVADNPLSDTCYYPDSKKWMVEVPFDRVIRSEPLDYFDGEE